MMEQILLKSLIISLAIVGLRLVTSPGMIGYPLRKPFENLEGWKQYVMKPIILCTTCMASVWTVVIEMAYFKLSWWTLITIFIVACINSILMALYDKLNE